MSAAVRVRPTLRSPATIATAAAAIGAAASFYIGETWLYAHVERPIGTRLCGASCSFDGEPRIVAVPLVLAAIALLLVGTLLIAATRGRRMRSKVKDDAILISGIVFVAAIAVIGKRSDGFQLSIDTPGNQSAAPPGSPAWVILGIALTAVAVGLQHRAQRTHPLR